MAEQENFETFNLTLNSKTKSLHLLLNQPPKKKKMYLTKKLMLELQTLFSWLKTHIEINTLYISSSTKYFCHGIDPLFLANCSLEQLLEINQCLEHLIYEGRQLPQTIIMDLGMGSCNIGIEFSLIADIRISDKKAALNFNYLENGLVPRSGGISILSSLIPYQKIQNWILEGKNVLSKELVSTGYISSSYHDKNKETVISDLLLSINKQSPVCRVQTKISLYEIIKDELIARQKHEKTFANAAMSIGDWHKIATAGAKYVKAAHTPLKGIREFISQNIQD